jgi:hypothetical protein
MQFYQVFAGRAVRARKYEHERAVQQLAGVVP